MSLTDLQRAAFREKGILKLERFLEKPQLAPARTYLDRELARLNVTKALRALPVFQQTTELSRRVPVGEEIERLFPSTLVSILTALAGRRLRAATPQPQLLLSLPHAEEWSLRGLNWHVDLAPPARDELTGIQAFVLIDDVVSRGGATLAIAGSHRLQHLPGLKNAQAALRTDPVFGALFDREREPVVTPRVIHGIETSVVELHGRAGDVFLMDLRVLHSPSINASKRVRKMATWRFVG